MKPTAIRFDVRVQGGEIIVTLADFCAIYIKPSTQPHLILKRRTDDSRSRNARTSMASCE